MPYGDRDRDRGCRGAGPVIADEIAEVRSITDWVPMRRASPRASPARRQAVVRPSAAAPGAAGSTTIAWPSDHSVSVVSATIITASGTSRRRTLGRAASNAPGTCDGACRAAASLVERRHVALGAHVARPRPEHVAAHDGRELDRPDEAGRQEPRPGEERRAEQVLALLQRVGHRDEDPLAVDQQVGQIVGDEVADRDRQQPGADRAPAHRPADDQRRAPITHRNTSSSRVFGTSAGLPNTDAKATSATGRRR